VLTVLLYICRAEGLLPGAGHRRDPGDFRGAASRSRSPRWRAPAAAGELDLEDPAVRSLSSFIGVDGANATLNSGRMLINLKPHERARCDAPRDSALQRRLANVEGIRSYMQPVQDLTIEDRVVAHAVPVHASRIAESDELPSGCRELVDSCARCRSSPTSRATAGQGLQAYVEIDRATRGRLGVTPASIDNALYNAFGQRLDLDDLHAASQYTASCSK
jgi:multidrug efflux pump